MNPSTHELFELPVEPNTERLVNLIGSHRQAETSVVV